jgi:hypothetical protein
MCGLVKPVACSHLISRSAYDHVDDGVTGPILVGDGYVMPTDRQIQDYLLCDGCEDILSKGGESWFTPKIGWPDRRFALWDMLKAGGGFHAAGEGEGIYYAAKNPDIHVEKIIHFAMGIFWKAGVHSWKGGEKNPLIELGPCQELIRLYLRGDIPFPGQFATLDVVVSRPERMQLTLNPPVRVPAPYHWRVFVFHTVGVMFTLNLGAIIDWQQRAMCFRGGRGNPVLVSDKVTRVYELKLAKEYLESRKTATYLKHRAKPRER